MRVEGLSPGKEYQFRVMAENVYGRSEPCEPTSIIKTEGEDMRAQKRRGYSVGKFLKSSMKYSLFK